MDNNTMGKLNSIDVKLSEIELRLVQLSNKIKNG